MSSQITVVGTLSAPPELRYTPAGVAVAQMSVADNHGRKNQSGEWEQTGTTWYRATAWREHAEQIAEADLGKGQQVIILGRLETRTYTDRAGAERLSLEITVDRIGPAVRLSPTRQQTTQGSSGGYGGGGQQARGRQQKAAPASDPWASSTGGSSTDEPPF